MTASTWKPDPATDLHNTLEQNAMSTVHIYYDVPDAVDPDPQEPRTVSYAAWWTSTPIPTFVSLVASPSGVNVGGPNVTGMSPIGIDYMLNNVSHHLNTWVDLPAANKAQKIYKYQAPGSNSVTATFNVRVTLDDTTFRDQSYTIRASIDYTSGRDRLVLEVNLRR